MDVASMFQPGLNFGTEILDENKSPKLVEKKVLVMEGGGVKGTALIGALEVLEEEGILAGIEKVSGTSAGAIVACLLGVGYSVEEIKHIVFELDFNKFMDADYGKIRNMYRLTQNYGWYKGEFFLDYIKELIFKKTGDPDITFSQLHERRMAGKTCYKDPYFVGANLSTREAEVFSYKSKNKDVSIAMAVRISMSIPLFFQAVRLNGYLYVDGGILNNFPISIFDQESEIPSYILNNNSKNKYQKMYNPEVIGIRLDSQEEINFFFHGEKCPKKEIDTFYKYSQALLATIMNIQNLNHFNSQWDMHRTIYCNTYDIDYKNFNLNDAQKKLLIESGRKAAKYYFACRRSSYENRKLFQPDPKPKKVLHYFNKEKKADTINEDANIHSIEDTTKPLPKV